MNKYIVIKYVNNMIESCVSFEFLDAAKIAAKKYAADHMDNKAEVVELKFSYILNIVTEIEYA